MRYVGTVFGDEEQAKEIIIGKDTVYVHSNIEKLENGEYKYDEVQYGVDEFIYMLAEKNKKAEEDITNTQLALCELFEALEG